MCVSDEEPAPSSVLRGEREHEKELTEQLKQANDTVARLQNKLRGAADRESRLQMQNELLDDIRRRSVPLWEKEMKDRDSKIAFFIISFLVKLYSTLTACLHA